MKKHTLEDILINAISIGSMICILGLTIIISQFSIKARCTHKTVGSVYSIEKIHNYDDDDPSYIKMIKYNIGDKIFFDSFETNEKGKVGDKIDVYYNPNNIEEHRINGDVNTLLWGVILLIFGICILSSGIYKRIKNKYEEEK